MRGFTRMRILLILGCILGLPTLVAFGQQPVPPQKSGSAFNVLAQPLSAPAQSVAWRDWADYPTIRPSQAVTVFNNSTASTGLAAAQYTPGSQLPSVGTQAQPVLQPPPSSSILPPPSEHDGEIWKPREFLPQGLLWTPPLAILAEPRLMVSPTTFQSNLTRNTIDLSIGQTAGIIRFNSVDPNGFSLQVDGFAVLHARFSEFDFLYAEDYRAGLPVTWQYGRWHGKISYEHVSTHLGDEVAERNNLRRREYQKNDIVIGLGHYIGDSLRLYGQGGYALTQTVLTRDASLLRFDLGWEWFNRAASSIRGQPFFAANVNFDGSRRNFSPSYNVQAGWLWRKSNQRFGQFRIYGQYYNGFSPYGQFADNREVFGAFGVSLDY